MADTGTGSDRRELSISESRTCGKTSGGGCDSAGTYLCWINLEAYVSADEMKEVIQKKCRLAVDFGDWFGGERFGTFIRMNLATSKENVEIGVNALIANLVRK